MSTMTALPNKLPDPDIEIEDIYHGPITTEELPPLLECYGDYLVRLERPIYVLCVNIGEETPKIQEIPILKEDDHYLLPQGFPYDKVRDLIKDLADRKTKLPGDFENHLLKKAITKPWEMKHDWIDFDGGEVIGKGTFGTVKTATLTLCKKTFKVVVKIAESVEDPADRLMLLSLLNEVRPMRIVDHPNCIKFFGVAVDQDPIMMVLEMVNMGTLQSYLCQEREAPLSPMDKAKLAVQAAWGLEYLHSKNVIHRHIITKNCLLNKAEGSEKIQLKIGDSELSRVGIEYREKGVFRLPVRHMSPESLLMNVYTSMTDVWMFGALLFEIYADGKVPYNEEKSAVVKEKIIKGETMDVPKEFPGHAIELINACWRMDGPDRPTLPEICNALEKYTKESPPTLVDRKKWKSAVQKENDRSLRSGRDKKKKKADKEEKSKRGAKAKPNKEEGSQRGAVKAKPAKEEGSVRGGVKKPNKEEGSTRGTKRSNNEGSMRGTKAKPSKDEGSVRGKKKEKEKEDAPSIRGKKAKKGKEKEDASTRSTKKTKNTKRGKR